MKFVSFPPDVLENKLADYSAIRFKIPLRG